MAELLLTEENHIKTYLVQDGEKGPAVIKKVLDVENPTQKQIHDFQYEFNILNDLDLNGIRKPVELKNEDGKEVAFYQYFDGLTLRKVIESGKVDIPLFLKIGLFLANSLEKLHNKRVIHKSVNSHNILVGPSQDSFCLIDFTHASTYKEKTHQLGNPIYIPGDLAYISPEQTGRMNRRIDARSDLYSVGVVLYEALTGSLPFNDKDPLELVHGHIAREPDLSKIVQQYPNPIGEIISKLLSKEAEARYQSASGLKFDLELFQALYTNDRLDEWRIGSNDFSIELRIAQKLFGRDREIEALNREFKHVSAGGLSALFVSGYSGVGKSALVYEVYKSISRANGYFIKGKYDQLQRNIPYYAIGQSLKEYVNFLLTEPPRAREKTTKLIRTALGKEGKLITDIVPTFESLLGKQEPLRRLTGLEAQNRFNFVFLKLIRAITSAGNPIVMFIDDLQWADLASLQLISSLLRDESLKSLLFVGSYRDNEVSTGHALVKVIDDLRKQNIQLTELHLEGLQVEDVSDLLSETLDQEVADVADLAILIHQRTLGNAFYINQVINALFQNEVLIYSQKEKQWIWDLGMVRKMQISENVIDLLSERLTLLGSNVQLVFQTASCIGNYFELEQLQLLLNDADININHCITRGLEEELIEISGDGFSFVHDRIQQAIYSSNQEEKRQFLHLEIGRALLEKGDDLDTKVFEIVDQLNSGRELVENEEEKIRFAQLNHQAGLKAKESTAYDSASEYFESALYFLDHDWNRHYDLLLDLYTDSGAVAHLSGEYEKANELTSKAIENSKTLLNKIEAYRIQIEICKSQNELALAVEKGLEVLKLLGIDMPYKPSKGRIFYGLLGVKLTLLRRNILGLVDNKQMKDPLFIASMQILVAIGPAVYWASPNLIPLTVFNMVNLSVKKGHTDEAIFAYSTYGLFLCGLLGQIKNGLKFGTLSLLLSERIEGPNRVKGIFNVHCFVHHWGNPLSQSFQPLSEAYQLGLENGDLEFGALSTYVHCNHLFYSGAHLNELNEKMHLVNRDIKRIKQFTSLNYNTMHHQAVMCLLGETKDLIAFDGPAYKEDEMLSKHKDVNDHTALFKYHLLKLILSCYYHKYDEAVAHGQNCEPYIAAVTGMFVTPVYYFHKGLAIILAYRGENRRATSTQKLGSIIRKMKKWAKNSPENHSHRYSLLMAEYSFLKNKIPKARKFYSDAVRLADENGFSQDKAFALELRGRFYAETDDKELSQHYLIKSAQAFAEWGAQAKVNEMIHSYQLSSLSSNIGESITQKKSNRPAESVLNSIDVTTIAKASTAIGENLDFAQLKSKLLRTLVENVGAERGVLLMAQGEDLVVEKEWPEKDEIQYSPSIVSLVHKTDEQVVLGNAIDDQTFGDDPYIINGNIKSVLCFPITYQNETLAIIYLENNLIFGAFDQERIETLKLLSGQIAVSLKNSLLFNNLDTAYKEQVRLKEAFSQFVPMDVLKFLGKDSILDVQVGDQVQEEVTVMFMDIKDYTSISEGLSPEENFNFINECLRRVSPSISENGGFICQFLGDGLMAIFKDGADSALKAAIAIQESVTQFNIDHSRSGASKFEVGVGLHTGNVMVGIIGDENRMDQNVISDTVNVSSRVQDLTRFYGSPIILTSQTIDRLNDEKLEDFRNLGRVLVKGKIKEIEIYECLQGFSKDQRELRIKTKMEYDSALSDYFKMEFSSAAVKLDAIKKRNPEDRAVAFFLERAATLMTEGVPDGWAGVETIYTK